MQQSNQMESKLVVSPSNTPRNSETMKALNSFIEMSPAEKIEIYENSIRYLEAARNNIGCAETLLPYSNYMVFHAKENLRNRIEELRYMIKQQERSIADTETFRAELHANHAAAKGETA